MIEDSVLVLGTGETRRIRAIGDGEQSAKRLADMGFIRGEQVEMVRTGKPCIVRINSSLVALGEGYQACVELDTH